jgi:uncharacterized protein (TIGR02246 family)
VTRALRPLCLLLALLPAACAGPPRAGAADRHAAAVASVLDELHEAAARADGERYFALFTPDAVFLGTDDSEHWTIDRFRAYAEPSFAQGRGWTYTVADRRVALAPGGRAAWFEERLDNEKYGRCRGSGVLLRTDRGWKIAQYNLTVPVPNDLLADVAAQIRRHSPPPAP